MKRDRQRVYLDKDLVDAIGLRCKEVNVELYNMLDVVLRKEFNVELKELKKVYNERENM